MAWGQAASHSAQRYVAQPQKISSLQGIEEVAGTHYHTLARLSNGSVVAWGGNWGGQLGTLTPQRSTTPLVVSGVTTAAQVAGGYDFSLARLNDNTVVSWGANWAGQLGHGTSAATLTPTAVLGGNLSPLGNVEAIEAGTAFGLALLQDGTLRAWGANAEGTLGNDTLVASSTAVTVVAQVGSTAPLVNVAAIAANREHALALLTDGTVRAWGANTNGQLGDGTTTDSPAPVTVTGLTNVVAIASGNGFSAAVRTDGTLWTWGVNHFGQLGNGTTTSSNSPQLVSSLQNVATVSAGDSWTMARTSDGSLWAWGRNSYGELGNGSQQQSSTPTKVVGLDVSVQALCGFYAGYSVDSQRTLWAWGYNADGQLGNETVLCATTPQRSIGIGHVREVASYTGNTYALHRNAFAYGWGENSFGHLGSGNLASTTAPVVMREANGQAMAGVEAVAGGSQFAVALLANGTLRAWGRTDSGRLGDGQSNTSVAYRSDPVTVITSASDTTPIGSVVAVAAGSLHSAALLGDKTLRAWGANNFGQLGNATTTAAPAPVTVVADANTSAPLTNVVAIACGGNHTLALLADGTVRAWGYNAAGQLGDDTTTNSATPVTVVAQTGSSAPLTNVVAIAAGANHSAALLTDGSVRTWGSGTSGELGEGALVNRAAPVAMSNATGVETVVAGDGFTAVLLTDGSIRVCGTNSTGVLGDGSSLDVVRSVPAVVPHSRRFTYVAASQTTLFAVANKH